VTRRPKHDPVRIEGPIQRVLRELGHAGGSTTVRIAGCWEELVGAESAEHSRPSALRGGLLEVTVDSSVWSQHLQMRRDEILAGLRDALGSDAPADLRFRVG
jgi:predicted nucleic acid-binding Zn ribbon protein